MTKEELDKICHMFRASVNPYNEYVIEELDNLFKDDVVISSIEICTNNGRVRLQSEFCDLELVRTLAKQQAEMQKKQIEDAAKAFERIKVEF